MEEVRGSIPLSSTRNPRSDDLGFVRFRTRGTWRSALVHTVGMYTPSILDTPVVTVGPIDPSQPARAITGDWAVSSGELEIGIWECTPGRFTADRTKASEFCHLISGRIEMTHADGRKVQLGAGDAINLPLGWTGEWRVLEQVRKLYVITSG